MKISVNLASRPFVELRPYFLRLRWIMGGLALLIVLLLVGTHLVQQRVDAAQAQMDALQARAERAATEKQSNERRMRLPANAAVLARAHFLNALFLRKSFSWTAVMMDLETVLPTGVMVTSIEPQITADGDVNIRLRVSGERDRAVQLVRNLERSKRFLNPQLNSESVQGKEQGQAAAANGPPAGVEFEILAKYNPLPEGEAYARVKPAAAPAKASEHGKLPGVVLAPFHPNTPKAGAR